MSSIINPVLRVDGDRKLAVVTITVAAGAQYGTGTAAGLQRIDQALSWSVSGNGSTATGQGYLKDTPYVPATGLQPNAVGVSLVSAAGGAPETVTVLVQGD